MLAQSTLADGGMKMWEDM